MPDSVYTQMLASRPPNLDLTSRVVQGTSIADLSEKALTRLKEFLAKRSDNWKELSDLEILSDLLLIENCELTYAEFYFLESQLRFKDTYRKQNSDIFGTLQRMMLNTAITIETVLHASQLSFSLIYFYLRLKRKS